MLSKRTLSRIVNSNKVIYKISLRTNVINVKSSEIHYEDNYIPLYRESKHNYMTYNVKNMKISTFLTYFSIFSMISSISLGPFSIIPIVSIPIILQTQYDYFTYRRLTIFSLKNILLRNDFKKVLVQGNDGFWKEFNPEDISPLNEKEFELVNLKKGGKSMKANFFPLKIRNRVYLFSFYGEMPNKKIFKALGENYKNLLIIKDHQHSKNEEVVKTSEKKAKFTKLNTDDGINYFL